ncbi:MAG TPA: DUF2795 domain-containing protein [Gemmataceae bacterium]|nr:DUF2795 domain-containing protein [Gemmataceae bacterium]
MALLTGGKTPQDLRRFLEGVRYPADEQDLLHAARNNQAPNEIVGVLERMTAKKFHSFDEVIAAYGEMG